ncbi:hypothetical protein J4407_03100 [Candidatus Pacearchaeota archaeon]|nr:hypothetical protein [Candidatus Pacearchaeota archaeon]
MTDNIIDYEKAGREIVGKRNRQRGYADLRDVIEDVSERLNRVIEERINQERNY